jgi:hypothetical protein
MPKEDHALLFALPTKNSIFKKVRRSVSGVSTCGI